MTLQMTAQESRVERRAKSRANQNVDRKVDDAVDDAFNEIGNLFKKKKKPAETGATPTEETTSEEPAAATTGSLPGNGEPWESVQNTSPVSMAMDITTTKKNGKTEEMQMKMVFDEWQIGMAVTVDKSKSRMIFDTKNGTMTTITDDGESQQGFKMKMNKLNETMLPDASEYTVTKTGKKRTIDGYATEEYVIESKDGTTNAWITHDIDIDFSGLMGMLSNQMGAKKMASTRLYFGEENGFPIEATTVTENGKETILMHYHDIKIGAAIDRSTLDITGVKIMSVGF